LFLQGRRRFRSPDAPKPNDPEAQIYPLPAGVSAINLAPAKIARRPEQRTSPFASAAQAFAPPARDCGVAATNHPVALLLAVESISRKQLAISNAQSAGHSQCAA